MLITALEITDYKRVRKVAITPDADRHVILIGGKNAQGKSSTLDALTAAFGGAKQLAADPVRHGADEAAIYVELDGGKLTIERTITADGKTKLEVRDAEGAVRRPQEMLDKLVGARFLDPLAFLALPAKEQRAQLMKLIPDAKRIEELDGKRVRAFERRTEIGRDLTKAEGELARLEAEAVDVGEPIDVAALNEEVRKLAELQREGDGLGAVHAQAEREAAWANDTLGTVHIQIAGVEQQIAELQKTLAELRAQVPELEQTRDGALKKAADAKAKLDDAAKKWAELAPRREQLDADLRRADEHNRAVYAAEATAKRREEVARDVAKLKEDREACTKAIATIDQRKADILAAAKLPVEGLAIDDDGITLAGVPFSQASASERLRVALALAIAGSPGLNDVWIRDGALLDEDALELVAKHAAAAGKRVWIERVGTRDPGVIEIRDGEVATATRKTKSKAGDRVEV